MKRLVLLIALFPFATMAQQVPRKVVFEYDTAGNQIYRGIEIDMTSTVLSRAENEETQAEPQGIGYEDSKLKYYPNPVQDVLYVEWDRGYKTVATISLYTANHQVLQQIGNLSFENQTQVRFDQLPKGSYFMVVFYQDGTKENITIIKR
ncbi:T9SS type A sorting domain-containing protein [Myroides sp. 1354]|uniref:T9SS type A sorting domain-containing protein n=1 Tax=unclassified Myroides TaxID=2642485 RepID=UPI00257678AA|nr:MULTISPECIES: T9SS type A sorting domain-containing protein [unclassified Myroides]MDM1043528.1 T9SS type A sorting domain-containing protein [Myroides sp. R163-1]MDM1054422.1 T9SS type A sorting domain-containing protein [Myroides sp. 1354]MDM1067718.1 T9SS type A sorting domain-containing protein [Myroides sp. 1372]